MINHQIKLKICFGLLNVATSSKFRLQKTKSKIFEEIKFRCFSVTVVLNLRSFRSLINEISVLENLSDKSKKLSSPWHSLSGSSSGRIGFSWESISKLKLFAQKLEFESLVESLDLITSSVGKRTPLARWECECFRWLRRRHATLIYSSDAQTL